MKRLLLSVGLIALLAGCVVAPPRGEIVVRPSVEIEYIWDPVTVRYYYVDRGSRHYMPRDWKHPRHPHGGPPGQRKK